MRTLAYVIFGSTLCLVACGDDDGSQNNNGNTSQVICGDGVTGPGEECDLGGDNSDLAPDACRTNCRLAHCGDFVVDASELCDNGPQNGVSPSACKADCTPNACGDGYVGGDEECDDGNQSSGDGCRGDCLQDETDCGNGVVDPGEGCDDAGGNSDTIPDACRRDCQPARCGDTVIDSGENCDDGNAVDDLTCSADCENFCGDGVFNPTLGEECDLGRENGQSPVDCKDDCTVTTCGDGYLGGVDEECDDGGVTDGDGCDANCAVEERYACSGTPSLCGCAGYYRGTDCLECVVYVAEDATPVTVDGRSWLTAFRDVQSGIDAAHATGEGCEVWVKSGHYTVFETSAHDTVTLRSGVGVYGGFAGNETLRSQRDWRANRTLISGSTALPTISVYHVVSAFKVDNATLDGFVITEGAAIGSAFEGRGGGLSVVNSTLEVANCVIMDNDAIYGGGVSIAASTVTLRDCVVSQNYSTFSGGGIHLDYATATLSNLVVVGNWSTTGGGVLAQYSSLYLENVAAVGNSAIDLGGAFYLDLIRPVSINHGTVAWNVATTGGRGLEVVGSHLNVSNSVFWGNAGGGSEIQLDASSSTVSHVVYSSYEDGGAGEGNRSGDPGFLASPASEMVNAAAASDLGQTTLQAPMIGTPWTPGALRGTFVTIQDSAGPVWYLITDNTADTITVWGVVGGGMAEFYDPRLSASSACVDAGYGCPDPAGCTLTGNIPVPQTPTLDLVGDPRAQNASRTDTGDGDPTWLDMGAYEQ